MRHILTGSKLVTRQGERRVQNAYSLRCIPQVLGACSQALHYATEKLEIEMNAVTDNPLIFSDTNEIISRGNFHGEPIAFAMDFLKLGIAELASISERRNERLVNPQLNDLPAFLSPNPGLESGAMILQYTAAPLVSENKTLAHPASVDSIPSSANQEDHVSMGTIAARHAHQMLQNTRQVITIELICALEACTYRGPEKLAETTLAFYEKAREIIPEITPGFPANGPGGMHTDTLIEAIEIAAKHPFVKVMDVVEIEPTQDIRDMTSKTAAYLLLSLMNFIVRI